MDKSPKGLRLLSFGMYIKRTRSFMPDQALTDGGGIQGLAGLLVVLELMQRLMFDLELRKIPKPCEYFEMATGSGTGGYEN